MSYMRGPCYIWRDDTRVHVWAEDGYDGWDESSWAEGAGRPHRFPVWRSDSASGVGIRQEIADTYVVMIRRTGVRTANPACHRICRG